MPELPVKERIKTFEELILFFPRRLLWEKPKDALIFRICYNPDVVNKEPHKKQKSK